MNALRQCYPILSECEWNSSEHEHFFSFFNWKSKRRPALAPQTAENTDLNAGDSQIPRCGPHWQALNQE
jgi:hypothetical protein